jgi:hypothetical protein
MFSSLFSPFCLVAIFAAGFYFISTGVVRMKLYIVDGSIGNPVSSEVIEIGTPIAWGDSAITTGSAVAYIPNKSTKFRDCL